MLVPVPPPHGTHTGLYCTHGDLSSRYASVLLGLTNIAGSLPGVIGVASVGILVGATLCLQ
jgi:ACS family sodium-dependent inorganic phosphate cotransporter